MIRGLLNKMKKLNSVETMHSVILVVKHLNVTKQMK